MARLRLPASLRRLVIERAQGCCEYCLIHQDDTEFTHHIDHCLARKHGGQTVSRNLALACVECNLHKGADVAAIDPVEQVTVVLFNPRVQTWSEHFSLDAAHIMGKTPIGRATVALLRMNDPARLLERQRLLVAGRYPLPLYVS